MLDCEYGKIKVHLLNGGGVVPAGTLSSGATLLNKGDYNIKEYGGTLTCYSLFTYKEKRWVGGRYGRK